MLRAPHRPYSPYRCRGDHDPAGLQAALLELRAHNRELRQRLQQRHEEVGAYRAPMGYLWGTYGVTRRECRSVSVRRGSYGG